jgi:hypothetical protein
MIQLFFWLLLLLALPLLGMRWPKHATAIPTLHSRACFDMLRRAYTPAEGDEVFAFM